MIPKNVERLFLCCVIIAALFLLDLVNPLEIMARSADTGQTILVTTQYKKPPAGKQVSSARRSSSHRVKSPRTKTAIIKQGKEEAVSAKSFIIMDGASGATLSAKAPDIPRQPASTIKVLTGLLALDNLNSFELVPTSRRAARMPRSKVYLKQGKSYPARDLVNAVLLASANDASVALAEKIGGSEKKFAKKMTALAHSLGARNTVCKTASGLTARGQKTTARDLAVIFDHAMENQEFARRMSCVKLRTRDGKILRNHNKALWQVEGAEGGKTGYTRAARQTYVGRFKRGNDEIVVAIMGSESMWEDIRYLVDYGFALKKKDIAKGRDSSPMAYADVVSFDYGPVLKILKDIKKISKL